VTAASRSRGLPDARVHGVAAGLHLVVTFPDRDHRLDDVALAQRLARTGVLVHQLSWHRHRPGAPGLMLGYAAQPAERLHDVARRLAQAIET
jgi:GntR family transcriptional regulator / MocR family aminotransferase